MGASFKPRIESMDERMALSATGTHALYQDIFIPAAVSGRITGVAVDPSDPSGNVVYVGTANGGVWKTTNGGSAW